MLASGPSQSVQVFREAVERAGLGHLWKPYHGTPGTAPTTGQAAMGFEVSKTNTFPRLALCTNCQLGVGQDEAPLITDPHNNILKESMCKSKKVSPPKVGATFLHRNGQKRNRINCVSTFLNWKT